MVVSHDMELVDRLASRVVVMSGGAVVADGRSRSVLSDVSGLERLGLAPPARHVLMDLVHRSAPAEADRVREALFPGLLAEHGRE